MRAWIAVLAVAVLPACGGGGGNLTGSTEARGTIEFSAPPAGSTFSVDRGGGWVSVPVTIHVTLPTTTTEVFAAAGFYDSSGRQCAVGASGLTGVLDPSALRTVNAGVRQTFVVPAVFVAGCTAPFTTTTLRLEAGKYLAGPGGNLVQVISTASYHWNVQ